MGSVLKQAQIDLILANGRNKKFAYWRFTARSWGRMSICMIPEKEAEKRLLWADYGHYMGLNLGLFWKIKRYNRPNLLPLESDGFTGVFWRIFYDIFDDKLCPPQGRPFGSDGRYRTRGYGGRQPPSHQVNYPLPAKYFRKMSGSAAEDFRK